MPLLLLIIYTLINTILFLNCYKKNISIVKIWSIIAKMIKQFQNEEPIFSNHFIFVISC